MRELFSLSLTVALLAGCNSFNRQIKPESSDDFAWEYWRNPDGYLEDQAKVLFGLIDETLEQNPATAKPSG